MGGGGEQSETIIPSQDAIITHSHTPSLPIMQYSPYNVGPRYCNPPSPHAHVSLCLVPAKWCREGWGCWCSFWDRMGPCTGATSGSRIQWKSRCQGEACWVRVSLAQGLFCLIRDLLAELDLVPPWGLLGDWDLLGVVWCGVVYVCLSICAGQGVWPCV